MHLLAWSLARRRFAYYKKVSTVIAMGYYIRRCLARVQLLSLTCDFLQQRGLLTHPTSCYTILSAWSIIYSLCIRVGISVIVRNYYVNVIVCVSPFFKDLQARCFRSPHVDLHAPCFTLSDDVCHWYASMSSLA